MNGNLKPFERAVYKHTESVSAFISRQVARGIDPEIAMRAWDRLAADEVFKNDEYQVAIRKDAPHGFGGKTVFWHLSIKRLVQKSIHDWRDLQAIKTMLVGPEAEALELYPAESRVMDAANQYHLWAIVVGPGGDSHPMIPIGSIDPREVTGPALAKSMGAKQRPLGRRNDENRPA